MAKNPGSFPKMSMPFLAMATTALSFQASLLQAATQATDQGFQIASQVLENKAQTQEQALDLLDKHIKDTQQTVQTLQEELQEGPDLNSLKNEKKQRFIKALKKASSHSLLIMASLLAVISTREAIEEAIESDYLQDYFPRLQQEGIGLWTGKFTRRNLATKLRKVCLPHTWETRLESLQEIFATLGKIVLPPLAFAYLASYTWKDWKAMPGDMKELFLATRDLFFSKDAKKLA